MCVVFKVFYQGGSVVSCDHWACWTTQAAQISPVFFFLPT
ncbi:hypothetical protein NP493_368g01014 [Ridgeia piscesae]|uniref:Uncharacterized protein n=1 Tax=Ridgeia piscesae TaxID=27915 RepID=A0AAD9L3Q8_RIDPI|nr:hypothetical protein NP493_368g01014 [Ridgeia piscesae]